MAEVNHLSIRETINCILSNAAPDYGQYVGESLHIDWHRPRDEAEDAAPSLNPTGENIDSIGFCDLIPSSDFPGMSLTVFFENIDADHDQSGEEWKRQPEQSSAKMTKHPGKQRLLTEVIMNDVITDPESQTRYADDDSACIGFRNVSPAAVSALLAILVNKFHADKDDIRALARAAELPVLRL